MVVSVSGCPDPLADAEEVARRADRPRTHRVIGPIGGVQGNDGTAGLRSTY